MVTLYIDQCKEWAERIKNGEKKPALCRASYTLLAGRTRVLPIPKELKKKHLDVIVINHDETFKDEITLRQDQ